MVADSPIGSSNSATNDARADRQPFTVSMAPGVGRGRRYQMEAEKGRHVGKMTMVSMSLMSPRRGTSPISCRDNRQSGAGGASDYPIGRDASRFMHEQQVGVSNDVDGDRPEEPGRICRTVTCHYYGLHIIIHSAIIKAGMVISRPHKGRSAHGLSWRGCSLLALPRRGYRGRCR